VITFSVLSSATTRSPLFAFLTFSGSDCLARQSHINFTARLWFYSRRTDWFFAGAKRKVRYLCDYTKNFDLLEGMI